MGPYGILVPRSDDMFREGKPELKKEKIFCRYCRHLEDNIESKLCRHPNNRDHKRDTWYRPDQNGKLKPEKINRGNDCPWFEITHVIKDTYRSL